ncbi:hypothetical protein FQN60_002263, partial [Etheostoma spectabile]
MINEHIAALLADLQDVIMGSTLAKCAATDLGIQWAGWALAAAFRTEKFYDLAALWVFMTLLPTLMLNTEKRDVPLGTRDYLGWTIWGLGFATEAIADQQKLLFKRNPDNAGKFIQSGLWAYSRHPNYFGEILQWSGLWLSASSVMQGPQYLSVASPLFVWFLLRYVSGIPILEKQAMKKWGSVPGFQDYIKNTPLLL